MSTEIPAHALFGGPDHGLLWNVVLRHDSGIITSIDKAAAPPPARRNLRHSGPGQRPRSCAADRVILWRRQHALGELDHPLRVRTPPDPYLAAASALARSARAAAGR